MTWLSNTLARVTAKMTSAGSEAVQNVFYTRNAGGNQADSTTIAALLEWMEFVYGPLQQFQSEHTVFSSVNILLEGNNTALGDFAWPTLTVGGATGDQLPASAAMLSLHRTGVSNHVGRKYWGPFSESHQNDGLWLAALTAVGLTVATRASDPFTASNGIPSVPVIKDRLTGTGRAIVEVGVSGVVRSQRRRNVGVGI